MRRARSPYVENLHRMIMGSGGYFNAHLHLDRAGTYDATLKLLGLGNDSASHLSLSKKHSIIPLIHASDCYEPRQLEQRVQGIVDLLVANGTTRADTVVDVTADRVGLTALESLGRIRERMKGKLDLRLAAYSPLGFRDDEPRRWSLLEEGAAIADFIGGLPERDDQADYPEHIGYDVCCRRLLELSARLGKAIHIHVDQLNHPSDDGAERVVRLVREMGLGVPRGQEPKIWLIHVISPSTYDEARFQPLLTELASLNIGVICCPSAALSMRQIRPTLTPTFNSIARVLEMLAAGVQVRIGSDNLCDITSPAGTVDLMDEIFVLANALRFYDSEVLALIAAGKPLPEAARLRVADHLVHDQAHVARIAEKLYTPDKSIPG